MPYPKGKPQSEASKQKRREAMLARIVAGTFNHGFHKASFTPEAIAKRLATNKVNGTTARCVAAMAASMSRPDVRAKLSAERKRRFATPAGREQILAAAVAAQAPEVNERRRAAAKSYAASAAGREAKIRGGNAALKALRGAAARKSWVYNGQQFRSSWEVIFAKWLDGLDLRWEYEPETFKLATGCSYTPDFKVYLIDGPVWVEIKGLRRWSADKFELFHREVCVRSMLLSDAEIAAIS